MTTDPDVPAASLSVWPYDSWKTPDLAPTRDFRRLRCFVLCPFDRAGIILPIAESVAEQVGKFIGATIQVYFAGDLVGSSAIHPDIWAHTLQADIVLADITGYNPNVMYELGVAAAWRPLATVIIVRDQDDGELIPFDIQPARQILYRSSSRHWMNKLHEQLENNMLASLTELPFQNEPQLDVPFSFHVQLDDGRDTPYLWSPGPGHRRLVDDGLEFGSLYYFPYSWLSVPKLRPAKVHVRAEMRFSAEDRRDKCWIGIAVRSQGYLADNEHLVWLNQEGKVLRTGPGVDSHGKDEHQVGQLSSFDPSNCTFVPFSVLIDESRWQLSVGEVNCTIPLSELPHVFPYGRIMLQTANCRAVVRNLRLDELTS